MIKTYLVPITDELIKAMEKGEAPSFLHCATCLDGLTNGEVIQKMFPELKVRYIDEWDDGNSKLLYRRAFVNVDFGHGEMLGFSLEWWNRKWGE